MPRSPVTRRPAASLVELLLVVGVLGLLVGLSASAVQAARGAAARLSCANNLRQIGLAALSHESAHASLPPAHGWWRGRRQWVAVPWTLVLLPELDQGPLWAAARAAHWDDPRGYVAPPHAGLATPVRVFACPADGRLAGPITGDGYTACYLSYAGVLGGGDGAANVGAMTYTVPWRPAGVRLAAVTDGASQTVLVGERPPGGVRLANNWYNVSVVYLDWEADGFRRGVALSACSDVNPGGCRPPFRFGPGRVDNRCDTHHFWSLHGGGANFALCDGSVRFLPYSAAAVLPALATRAGGEVVGLPD